MDQILYMRAMILKNYRKFETPLLYFFKFIMGLYIFSSINSYFAGLGTDYCTRLDKMTVVLLAAIVTSILPPTWVFILMWLFVVLHVFFFSLELSVILGLLLMCLILFYIRIFPKESYLIILLLFCFWIKVPYVVPLIAGLFVGLGSIGAIIAGIFIWNSAGYLKLFAGGGSTLEDLSLMSLPQSFADNYKLLVETLTENDMWVHMALVFVITVIVIRVLRDLPFKYSMEISIAVGAFTLLIGMMAGVASGDVTSGTFGIIISLFFSTVLAYICKFAYVVVDYDGTENVKFEDDSFVYYVKAVPKIGEEP